MSFDITTLGAPRSLGQPELRRALVIRADIGTPVEFPTTEGHVRAIFLILGGAALGQGWSARILPGGSDFARLLPSGDYAIEARYALEMSDGTPVFVTNAGLMLRQPDGSFHGRTRASLEVPPGPHAALGGAFYFGTALAPADDLDHVYIELWEAPL